MKINNLLFILLIFLSSCFAGPLSESSDDDEDTESVANNEVNNENYTSTEVIGFDKDIQNKYDDIILDALTKLSDSNLAFIEYKALIAVESSFNQYAESPTGAKGLLQFTSIAIQDVNQNPGKLGFYFDEPFDPKQSIYAGVRTFELIVSRLDSLFFNSNKGRPAQDEYKNILLTTYNAGIGTMVDALTFLNIEGPGIIFEELILPNPGQNVNTTPMYQSIIENAAGNGVLVNGEVDYDLVDFRFDEISSYAYNILELIPENAEKFLVK